MTVSVQQPFTASVASGVTTVFPYGFKVAHADDLSVSLDGVLQTTGYSVTGVGDDAGGDVIFDVAPGAAVKVLRYLSPSLNRQTDYQQFGDWTAAVVNLDFDRLWLAMQSIAQNTSRSLKLPVDTVDNQEIEADAATRANKGIRFDGDGNLVVSDYDPDEAQTLSASSAAAAAASEATCIAAAASTSAYKDDAEAAAIAAAASAASVDAANLLTKAGNLSGLASQSTARSNLGLGSTTPLEMQTGTETTVRSMSSADVRKAMFLRNYLAGLNLSTAGSSATMSISAGCAANSTNAVMINIAASINKTTSAWAVGSGKGGLDTGTVENSTWYHFFAIRRPDTGVTDALFSLSATAPTMPTNYTQFRRIGSGKTNGSAQWTKFVQNGDLFQWDTPVLDVDVTNPGTSAVLRTLNVPTGVSVVARFNHVMFDGSGTLLAMFSDPATADVAPTQTAASLCAFASVNATNAGNAGFDVVRTNTSAQIRSRISASAAGTAVRLSTISWIDARGMDA